MRRFSAFFLLPFGMLGALALSLVGLALTLVQPFATDPRTYLDRNATPRSIFDSRRMGLA
jgi:hypothetical protein